MAILLYRFRYKKLVRLLKVICSARVRQGGSDVMTGTREMFKG